jgi:hypothetical protein
MQQHVHEPQPHPLLRTVGVPLAEEGVVEADTLRPETELRIIRKEVHEQFNEK